MCAPLLENSISFKAYLTTIQQCLCVCVCSTKMFMIISTKTWPNNSVEKYVCRICIYAINRMTRSCSCTWISKRHLSHFYHSLPNYLFTYAEKVIMNNVKLKPLKNSQRDRDSKRFRRKFVMNSQTFQVKKLNDVVSWHLRQIENNHDAFIIIKVKTLMEIIRYALSISSALQNQTPMWVKKVPST